MPHSTAVSASSHEDEFSPESSANKTKVVRAGSAASSTVDVPRTPEEFARWKEQELKLRAENIERGKDQWRTPIEFYGKVVDQKERPVAGVRIAFSCNDLSAEGTSYYNTVSDTDGLFALKDVKGKLLVVRVSKDGYYTSNQENKSFEYGDPYEHFVPDRGNPVVFHLHKKGVAEQLVAASGRIKVPLNGVPIEVNLSNGKPVAAEQGHLRLECVSDYTNKTNGVFTWTLLLSVRGGGILHSTNEFDFEAPDQGYEAAYRIQMPSARENSWQSTLDRKFFLKLADGTFGRISLSFIAYNGVLRFQSFVNPSGSRNLEFDPDVQPK